MNKKIFMVVLSIFLMLIVMGCASAAGSDNITSTEDTDEITCNDDMLTVDESSTEGTDNDNLSLSEENTLKATDGEVLSTDYSISGSTFDDIAGAIDLTSERGTTYLSGNTYNPDYITTVKIEKSITLNGASNADSNNKATLDDTHGRINPTKILVISASNVVLKNIIFKNGHDDSAYFECGAIKIEEGANNVTIENCIFINNSAENNGGAIIWEGSNGSITDSIFENNYAEDFAGAISWSGANGAINNVTFTNNSASSAGAIYWTGANGTINNVTFTSNTINSGTGRGAAIVWQSTDGKITNTTFIKNTAKSKSVVYVYFTNGGQISGCSFANNTGGAIIYCGGSDSSVINNNIFLNNNGTEIYVTSSQINKDYNWFGNNATNYNVKPDSAGNIWLFLNATVSSGEIQKGGNASIIFKLDSYDGSTVSSYDAFDIAKFDLSLSSTEGSLNKYKASINEEIIYTASSEGDAIVKGQYENAVYAVNIKSRVITWYVNASKESSGDGKCDKNAFKTLSEALSASIAGETIMIASGTYVGSENVGLTVNKNNLTLTKYGDGEVIFDGQKTTRILTVNVTTINITGLTFQNGYAINGGAIYFNGELNNSVIDSNFSGNTVINYGGALYFNGGLNNSVIYSNFINNTVTNHEGGAIYFNGELNNSVIDSNFINNQAYDNGGAIYFNGILNNVKLFGSFTGNRARYGAGGANYFSNAVSDFIMSGNYIGNRASNGGANYFNGDLSTAYLTGKYIRNIASYYAACVFHASLSNVNLSGIFISNNDGINKSVRFDGVLSDVKVARSVFIDNTISSEYNLKVDSSWFGSNATNYNVLPNVGEHIELDNWLFLNATAYPNSISLFNSSEVDFDIYLYDKNERTTWHYIDYLFDDVNLTVNSTNGYVDKGTVNFNEKFTYTSTNGVTGSVTAAIENAGYTIEIYKIHISPDLSVENQVCVYGENATLTLNYNNSATGKVNISLKGKKYDYSFENIDLNKTITLQSISLDDYNVTVTYSGDERFSNSTANGTLKINKATIDIQSISELNITYGSQNTITITGKINNTKYGNPYTDNITATVEGMNNTSKVESDGTFSVIISNENIGKLATGKYNITVSLTGNDNYNPVSEKTFENKLTVTPATIAVQSLDSIVVAYGANNTLTVTGKVNNTEFGVNYDGNVTVSVEGMSNSSSVGSDGGFAVVIVNDNIGKLSVGKYNVSVAVNGDDNYKPADAKSFSDVLTVVQATIAVESVDNITVVYGANNTVTVTGKVNNTKFGVNYTGKVTAIIRNMVNSSSVNSDGSFAVVIVNDNIGKLSAGKHNVAVAVNGDDNYKLVSAKSFSDVLTVVQATIAVESVDNITVVYGANNTVTVTGKVNNTKFGVNYTGKVTAIIRNMVNSSSVNSDGSFAVVIVNDGIGELLAIKYNVAVAINGDDNYKLVSAKSFSDVLTVVPATIAVQSVDEIAIVYGANNTLTVTGKVNNTEFGVNYTGNVTVSIEGMSNSSSVGSDGGFAVVIVNDNIGKLSAGKYNVSVAVNGDGNYKPVDAKSFSDVLSVVPATIAVESVDNISIAYGENNTLFITGKIKNAKFGDNYTGNITVNIESMSNSSNVNSNGSFAVVIVNDVIGQLSAGKYNVSVAIGGDANYNPAESKSFDNVLTVVPATIAIQSVENISIVYGENNTVTVTGKLNNTKYGDNYTGVIAVNIGNQLTNTSNALNGEFSVVINGVKYWNAGEYTITVNGSETANYNSLSEKTTILNITKNQFEIDATVMGVYENDVKTDQNATVTVLNIPSAEFNTTGVIIVRVVELDKNYTINVPQNSMTVLDIITTPGTYTVTAQYTGNRNYNASNIVTKEFTVTFWNETNLQELIDNSTGNVTLEHNYTFTNENATVNVNKSVTINANGHTIDANGSSTALNITADNVSVDNVTVSNVNGTGILSNGTNTTLSNVELNNVNGTGILTSGDNATVANATLNNVTGSGIISQGDNATIDNTEMNNVNGTAITTMGDNATVSNTTLNNVNGTGIASSGANTSINNTEMNNVTGTGIVSLGENSTISNTSLSNINGTGIDSDAPNTTINNTNLENVNGTAIQINGDNAAVNNVTASNTTGTLMNITGDNIAITNVNSTNNSTILLDGKVNKTENITGATIIPSIRATSSVVKNDVIITATVSATEGNVTVLFEGVSYTVPLNDGKAIITIPNVGPGTYENVPVRYDGTSLYQNVSTTTSFTSKAAITGNKDVAIDYLSGYEYTVRVMNADGTYSAGTAVTFTVNGVTYTRTTDSNGYAKLLIELKPKTYTITTKFLNIKKTNKIKVKYTLKLVKKTVKVKKTAKKLILKAKLKWSNGKAIKGKIIKFKFKGKTYKAKTNKKGIAKVKIKKKVIKKLKAGKKYKFKAKYVNESVKGKVKVKR